VTDEKATRALERIATSLEAIAKMMRESKPAPLLPDSELDSDHGNPIVRKDPTNWKGRSFQGKRFSECSPEYLDLIARVKEWSAGKNEADPAKKKYADYDRLDAARARSWAARKRRDDWVEPQPSAAEVKPTGVFSKISPKQQQEAIDSLLSEDDIDF